MGSAIGGWMVAILLFGGLIATAEFAFRLGRRHSKGPKDVDPLGTLQGAILGILALLLGFSFAASSGRLSDRKQLILDEANAISTVWLRIDLMASPQQPSMRDLIRRYVDERITFYSAADDSLHRAAILHSEELQSKIWSKIAASVKASPELALQLLPPVDKMFDLHTQRVAAAEQHLPTLILILLLACSFISVGSVSYSSGIVKKRNLVMTLTLAFLIASVLWIIIDLDHPRRGLIRSGQKPMLELQEWLKSAAPSGESAAPK